MWKNQKRHDKQRRKDRSKTKRLAGWLAGAAWWNNDRASQDLYVDIEKRPGKKCPLSVTLLSVVLSSWPCRRRVSRGESWFNAMWNDRGSENRWIIGPAANSGYERGKKKKKNRGRPRPPMASIFSLVRELCNVSSFSYLSQLFVTEFYDSIILKRIKKLLDYKRIKNNCCRLTEAINTTTIYIGKSERILRPGLIIKSRCPGMNWWYSGYRDISALRMKHRNPLNF